MSRCRLPGPRPSLRQIRSSLARCAAASVRPSGRPTGPRRSTRRSRPSCRRAAARRTRSTGRSGARSPPCRGHACAAGRAAGPPHRAAAADGPRCRAARRPRPVAGYSAGARAAQAAGAVRGPHPGEPVGQVAVDVEVAADVGLGEAELAGRVEQPAGAHAGSPAPGSARPPAPPGCRPMPGCRRAAVRRAPSRPGRPVVARWSRQRAAPGCPSVAEGRRCFPTS